MSQPVAERKTLEVLAEEFVARYRRGERPALSEYIAAYPELAGEIRELFPTLVMMEELAPSDSGSSAAAPSTAAEQPRTALGDYRILREIGRGGMGVVYEAEQLSLGRRVALKVLPRRAGGDAVVRERFHREARAAAQLHHTNIVPVFEVGEDQDACWYAMQLILGQGLDQVIEELRQQRHLTESHSAPPTASAPVALSQVTQAIVRGQFAYPNLDASPPASADSSTAQVSLDPSDSSHAANRSELSVGDSTGGPYYRSVARIGRQAAEGLAYAHARGIVHRDIKPSNLLLDTTGVVWITDFGLAKTQDHSLTTTGDIVGTLRYMAPERFKGEGDERADVYSLGLTLYELLVLRPAFAERDRLQLIDHIKNQEPARPRAVDGRIPRDLETIVLKAIDKEARRRYPSAEVMAEDLRRFLADEPIKARRTSELERLRLWGRRNPALAALSSSLLLLLVLVAAGATAAALYLRATLKESEANRELAEKAELEGKQELWLSYLAQAQARRMSRQPGQRFASLRAIREALDLPVPPGHSRHELRTEAIAALCLADVEFARQGGRALVGSEGFAIDPAFGRYAFADKDGKVSIRRLSDDEELLQLPGAGYVSPYAGLIFSPDGRFLDQRCQVRQGRGARLWDLSESPPRMVRDDDHGSLTFRPDCRQYAASYPDRTLRIYETASGRELRRILIAAASPQFGVLWNPRLPQILIDARASLHLLNLDTGVVAKIGPAFARGHSSSWTAWHPEGRLFAVADQEMKIHLWDVATNRPVLPALEGHKANGVVLTFNHAGDRLLSSDWSAAWRLWDTRSGKLLLTVSAPGVSLHFASDDRLAGSGAFSKVHLFHVRPGEELRTIVHRNSPGKRSYATEGRIIVDAEGRLGAVEMHDKIEGIPIVDLVRGEEVALLPIPGNTPLQFERDGTLWTCGSAGLLRWPLTADPGTGQRRYGPPRRVLSGVNAALRASPDLQVVAIPYNEDGTVVVHRNTGRMLRLGPQDDVRFSAVSPDGRWVATGSHWHRQGPGAKVWDARDGRLVKDLPVGAGVVAFSPDGKWLLTTSGGCRLWAVGTWEEGPKLAGSDVHPSAAFSADGKLLALAEDPNAVRLVVTDTGAEVARLTAPEQTPLLPCAFSPDGRRLIAGGLTTRDLYVFDLAALRAGLSELGLDWDAPPLPAVSESENAPEPLSIQFDLGDLRHWAEAEALVKQAIQQVGSKEHAKALAALRRAVQIAPSFAVAHNNLAWLLLTGPKELRDPVQALVEARKAVELAPNRFIYHNTLGVALYRTAQFTEAIPVLERSLQEGKGRSDAFDLFFLAMCHHRLGDVARARDHRERGVRWLEGHKGKLSANWVAELTAFQAETDGVLAQPPK